MARQISAIKFIGTLGTLVGSKGLDGKVIIREKAASVANPQTKDQMDQRARMSLAAKVAGMLGEVGKLALKANGFRTTRRGTLIKSLLDKIQIVDDQKAGLPRVLNLVNNPAAPNFLVDITAMVDAEDNVITGILNDIPEDTLTAKALLVYDKTNQQWLHVSSLDTSSELVLRVPDQDNCDVYFYAEIVMPRTSEGKARLQQLIGEAPGYTISVARLDASNFAYSRTLNAGIVDGVKYDDMLDADQNAINRHNQELIDEHATNFGNILEEAIRLGLRKKAAEDGISVIDEFVKLNNTLFTPQNEEPSQYESLKISEGNMTGVGFDEPELDYPLTVKVGISEPRYEPGYNSEEDQVYGVIYNKHLKVARMVAGVRADENLTFVAPGNWQGTQVEMWAFVIGADHTPNAGVASATTYLGQGVIA